MHGLSEDCDHADSGTGNAKVNHRLAAILAADIALYRALMGADEARTVRDLKGHQTGVRPMIADHGGRVIDTAGILAELGSVVKRGPVRDRHPERRWPSANAEIGALRRWAAATALLHQRRRDEVPAQVTRGGWCNRDKKSGEES